MDTARNDSFACKWLLGCSTTRPGSSLQSSRKTERCPAADYTPAIEHRVSSYRTAYVYCCNIEAAFCNSLVEQQEKNVSILAPGWQMTNKPMPFPSREAGFDVVLAAAAVAAAAIAAAAIAAVAVLKATRKMKVNRRFRQHGRTRFDNMAEPVLYSFVRKPSLVVAVRFF